VTPLLGAGRVYRSGAPGFQSRIPYTSVLADATLSSCSEARLVAVTDEAAQALGGTRELRVTQFPFRVGRERRSYLSNDTLRVDASQRRRGEAPPDNDVYLHEEPSSTLHISGAHFAIECVDKRFFLVDRGSACGTMVAGDLIGGNRKGGRTELRDDDEVIVGTGRSRYIFRFRYPSFESSPRI
jgi:hypothetical protein